MKKLSKLAFFLAVMLVFALFGIRASALEESVYTVSEDGKEYKLYHSSSEDGGAIFCADKLQKIIDFIEEKERGAKVNFISASTDSTISVSSDMTLCGEILLGEGCDVLINGGKVVFSDAEITLNGGTVRVKRGELMLDGGSVVSSGAAITLDYEASATLTVLSGTVSGGGEEGSIILSAGSAVIRGGEVISEDGVAINSSSSLMLVGAPIVKGQGCGVYCSRPVTLGDGDKPFSGELTLRFDREFPVGEKHEVIRTATEESIKRVIVTDSFGVPMRLKFFSSENGSDPCVAVYRPHAVDFFSGGELVLTEEVLSGAKVALIDVPAKGGYRHEGWRVGSESGELFDPNSKIYSSLDLYASYVLLPPSFSLNSLSFEYDGEERRLGLNSLSHPELHEGIVEYVWHKNGKALGVYSSSVPIRYVSDSGTYSCLITLYVGGKSASVMTPEVEVDVSKGIVDIPKIEHKFYTGAYVAPDIQASSRYSAEYSGGVKVGSYPVVFTLKDYENYEFVGGYKQVFVNFNIQKSENEWVDELSVYDVYTGEAVSPLATAVFGECEFLYSTFKDGPFVTEPPFLAGDYYVVARVLGTEDYTSLISEPEQFRIIEEVPLGMKVTSLPYKLEYVAFDRLIPDGISVSVSYNSGRCEDLGAESLEFIYNNGDTFRFGDTFVTLAFRGVRAVVGVSVERARYDLSAFVFSDVTLVYDGTLKLPQAYGEIPVGLDGTTPEFSVSGGGVTCGEYEATVTFTTVSRDYSAPDPIVAQVTVLPLGRDVVWGERIFVFDGEIKCPVAYYTDVFGRRVDLFVSGGRTYAGAYTATAVCADMNYKLTSYETLFTIEKADYDFSNVSWSSTEFIYDGTEKNVRISGLPLGVGAVGYVDNFATDAGFYTARVTLSYDEANYNPPPTLSCSWRILRAEYPDVEGCFSDCSAVFDGLTHYPGILSDMPIGADGIKLRFSFSGGATHVSEGRVAVKITFSTSSKNYVVPDEIIRYAEILPKAIYVVWTELMHVYDGSLKLASASSDICSVTVTGAKKNAGKYTVYATALSSDYEVVNREAEMIIERAENAWLTPPGTDDVFFGRPPMPKAIPVAGEVEYRYYSDADMRIEIEQPREVGEYYVVAVGVGDDNYKGIVSSPMKFRIIEIIPVGIRIELLVTPTAKTRISSDSYIAYIINNDGSEAPLSASLVEVKYEKGDALSVTDGKIEFSYQGFTTALAVKVEKARYDLSGVIWNSLVYVYDGTEKHAVLTNLPEGVSVREYVGNGKINAGEYKIRAILDYDEESYMPPLDVEAVMRIEKCVIPLPEHAPLIYNGKEQYPIAGQSDKYFASDILKGRDAGEYFVTYSVADTENYTFPTGDSATVGYEIRKMRLKIAVNDVKLYLFTSEKNLKPGYVIIEGEYIGDLEGSICYNAVGDLIYVNIDDGNYDIDVTPGKIERIDRLSPTMRTLALIIFTAFLIGIFALLIIYLYRDRLLRFYSRRLSDGAEIDDTVFEKYVSENEAIEIPCEDSDLTVSEEESSEKSGSDETGDVGNIVNAEYADEVITDSMAKSLVRRDESVVTDGYKRRIVNVDTISRSFLSNDRVDVNTLKEHSLIPYDTAYIKVLARGMIDKPLFVYANDFSLSAVKMIALAGGKAVRVNTVIRNKNFKKGIEKESVR